MSSVERGKRIRMTFRERGETGKPTLIVTVSAEDDTLPHEHREDMKEVAAAVMGVPLKTLEGVEVELRRAVHPGVHPEGHPEHPHPHAHTGEGEDQDEGEKPLEA